MKNRRFVTISLFLIGLFLVQGIIIPGTQVSVSLFDDFDEDDIVSFLTTYLDNVTAEISTSALASNYFARAKLAGGSNVIELGRIGVTASTAAYSRSAFEQVSGRDTLHSISFEQMKATANLAARYKLAGLSGSVSLLNIMDTANDTSEAAGTNIVETQEYSINDILPTDDADNYQTNITDYAYWPTAESYYQGYAALLAKNSSDDDFTDDTLSTRNDYNTHASVITDVEFSMLEILKSNIAANYSTTSNIIDPDDVTILDYDFNASDPAAALVDLYLSSGMVNEVREDIAENEKTTSFKQQSTILLFGVPLFKSGVVRVSARTAYAPELDNVQRISIGRVGVTKQFTSTTEATKLAPLSSTTFSKSINMGRGIAQAALAKPETYLKTVNTEPKEYASHVELNANTGESFAKDGKLTKDDAGSIVAKPKKQLRDYLPYIIVGGLFLVAVALGAVALYKRSKRHSSTAPYDDYFY
ncbi:MAG: hypothetical protein ACFFD4_02575 [Candidatus Odinarchaeota archaeon]